MAVVRLLAATRVMLLFNATLRCPKTFFYLAHGGFSSHRDYREPAVAMALTACPNQAGFIVLLRTAFDDADNITF